MIHNSLSKNNGIYEYYLFDVDVIIDPFSFVNPLLKFEIEAPGYTLGFRYSLYTQALVFGENYELVTVTSCGPEKNPYIQLVLPHSWGAEIDITPDWTLTLYQDFKYGQGSIYNQLIVNLILTGLITGTAVIKKGSFFEIASFISI